MTVTEKPYVFGKIPVGPARELIPIQKLPYASGEDLERFRGATLSVSSEDKLKLTIPGFRPGYYRKEAINTRKFTNGRSKRFSFVVYKIGWKETTPRKQTQRRRR